MSQSLPEDSSVPAAARRSDPMAEVVALLKPMPSISKLVEAGGRWQVDRRDMSSPYYCALLEGTCVLKIAGREPLRLIAGDFVLVPAIFAFTMQSLDPPVPGAPRLPLETAPGRFRLGDPDGPVDVRALVGHCEVGAPDKDLLLSLLPEVLHIRDEGRIAVLGRMIHEELRADRPARDMLLERLLEVLLIEALRARAGSDFPPGLLRGLADPRLAAALQRIHANGPGALTVAELASAAGMSRSAFFDRFRHEVGQAPMVYVSTWKMARAKSMLAGGRLTIAQIAERVGYGSASAFGLAFSRQVGMPPGAFARHRGERSAPG